MQSIRVERQIGGRTLSIETGTLAKLADGAVTVQFGDTVVFGAVVRALPHSWPRTIRTEGGRRGSCTCDLPSKE